MLLTGPGDELCGLLPALFQAAAYHLPAPCQPFCLSSLCLLKVHTEISSLLLPPSSVHLQHPTPLLCVSFQFLIQFLCVCIAGGGQFAQGAMLVYPRVAVGILHATYLLTCWSAECLPSKFGASIWWYRRPPVFSV
jgi:hypothetical protein